MAVRQVKLMIAKDLDKRFFTEGNTYTEILYSKSIIVDGVCLLADDGKPTWINRSRVVPV